MKTKLDIKLMGVKKRRALMLETLSRTGLDPSCIVFDDRGESGGGNCWYTAKKAWLAPLPEGTTHRLVLQDDALVCNDFVETVNKIVETFPDVAWALNGGVWLKESMRKTESPYINLRGAKCSGEAIIFPVEHIKPMIEWSDSIFGEEYIHDMTRYGYYCAYHKIRMFGTIPSLVDHLQVDSFIPHHNRRDRVCKTWIGENLGEQDWGNKDYNESPVILSNIWLPKNDERWEKVNEIVRISKENARSDVK